MKVALIVPGGVDRSRERRVIPAILALLKRLAAEHEVHVFALSQEPLPGYWMLFDAHIHNIGGASAVARPIRTVKAILSEHRKAPFEIIHSIWAGTCGLIAVCAAQWTSVPSIVHVAGGEFAAISRIGYGGELTWRGRLVGSIVLHGATAITAASDPIIRQIEERGGKARRIPLGVDLEIWPPRIPIRRDPRMPLRLMHAASLNRVKDQTTLMEAIARFAQLSPGFTLDVVGEDTLNGAIQRVASRLGIATQTRFHGFLTQRELRSLMQEAHINLISSLHEAGPLVVLEAAVAGVPTVGTSVGHIAEWAPQAALAVPPANPLLLAEAIKTLADHEDLRHKLAIEAQRRAIAEDAQHTFKSFVRLYADLTGRARAPV